MTFTIEEKSTKTSATSYIFKKTTQRLKNHPIGKNPPNLVTLSAPVAFVGHSTISR
jgi:hypothetical protein